ncbi:MAG: transposase [Ignavibacteriaceae bacterium]|nr:transposase [Ignavibacteriaceae bacterium]
MAKRNVVFKAGRYFHIYNRGAGKAKIFFEEDNYIYLLKKIKEYSAKYEFSVIAYSLMPNHFHLLLRQDAEQSLNIALGFMFNAYTKAINKKYSRSGTLFEGSFKSIHVEDAKYLMELCRYIHRNPFDDGLVKNIEDWKYSNYLEWINKRNGSLIDKKFRDKYFPEGKGYQTFVLDHLSNKHVAKMIKQYLLKLKSGEAHL